PLAVGREARVDVAGAVDGHALGVGTVLVDGPQVAEVAEDDLALVVVGMAGELDLDGLRRRGDQASQKGRQAHPAAAVGAEHAGSLVETGLRTGRRWIGIYGGGRGVTIRNRNFAG